MVQGFERRDIVKDANAAPRSLDASTVPLSPIMAPQPASMSGVGQGSRDLAEALGGVSVGYDKYVEKKRDEWELEGKMRYAEGATEEEIRKTGNRYTTAGYMGMKAKVAGDEWYQNELASLDPAVDSKTYQAGLKARYKEVMGGVANGDPLVRKMLAASAADMFPRLVSEQIKRNNKYNKEQHMDAGRQMIVSTANTDGPDQAREIMSRDLYPELNDEEYSKMVANSLEDDYGMGSDNVEKALLNPNRPAAAPRVAGPGNVSSILNVIGHAESNNNYNAIYSGTNPRLTTMTLDEVAQLQDSMVAKNGKSSAVGKYQIISKTLNGLKEKMGLTGKEVFDETLQDKMAIELLRQRGIDKFLSGEMPADKFQYAISQEWAGLPRDSSGLSYYDGDGLNKATVEPGMVIEALGGDLNATDLYSGLSQLGMRSEDISRVVKARDKLQTEKSAKFSAARLLTERDITQASVNLSDEDLIKRIDEAKAAGGYSDAWANSLWNDSQSAKKKELEERKKVEKVQTLIQTNSVAQGSKEEQQKAVDIITEAAIRSFPDASNADSPNQATARRAAMDSVFKFMHANNIVDERLKTSWETATMGDIIDGDGKVKETALDAYTGYRQAMSATNDPLFAGKLLSDKTSTLFTMADSYMVETGDGDPAQALATASANFTKQEQMKGVNNLPWWKDYEQSQKVTDKLVNATLPGFLRAFGAGRSEAQMRWAFDEDAVARAASSPEVLDRIKIEASRLWSGTKHWGDQTLARDVAVAKASQQVMSKSEYVAGTFVYTGDQPTIAERIGMGGIKNGTNMVVSRVMEQVGPTIWKDFNKTDIYAMSQSWYAEDPGLAKGAKWVGSVVAETVSSPIDTLGKVGDKIGEKLHGVPDFQVTLNTTGNALILRPYTNLERTQMGPAFILPVEKLTEAAAMLKKKDDKAFKEWAEEYKSAVPKY